MNTRYEKAVIVQVPSFQSAVIAANASQTTTPINATDLAGRNFLICVRGGWTSADLGFLFTVDDKIWYPLYDSVGTRVRVTNIGTLSAPSERAFFIPQTYGLGAALRFHIQSLNTSTGALINQTAQRDFQIIPLN